MQITKPSCVGRSTAVVYLARGAAPDHLERFKAFLNSYRRFSAGHDHSLFVIIKGFRDDVRRAEAQALFAGWKATEIFTADTTFDLGAYAEALPQIPHDRICFLNTNSEISGEKWLAKLAVNLDQPRVGIVSATGSFESLTALDSRFPRFPNVHVRSNAFMIERTVAIGILGSFKIANKLDAHLAESGIFGITRQVHAMGMMALIVGRNGRGYQPQTWGLSDTFRQGTQGNLLVHDNVTRQFDKLDWRTKAIVAASTWGEYLQPEKALLLPP